MTEKGVRKVTLRARLRACGASWCVPIAARGLHCYRAMHDHYTVRLFLARGEEAWSLELDVRASGERDAIRRAVDSLEEPDRCDVTGATARRYEGRLS